MPKQDNSWFRSNNAFSNDSVKVAKSTTYKDVKQDRKIAKLQRVVKKMAPELMVNSQLSTISPAAQRAGTGTYICTIAQGDDVNQRTGDKITLLSLRFRYIQYNDSTGTAGITRLYRCVIFRANDQVTTQPNYADVFPDATIGSHPGRTDVLTKPSKYTILYDKIFTAGGQGSAAASFIPRRYHVINKTIHFKKGLDVDFSGTGATIASAGHNALHFVIFSDAPADADTTNGFANWYTRYTG